MKRLLLAIALFLLLLAAPATVHADVNNFTITDFTADETLTRDDPQGVLHIVERINVDFTDYNHGILRAVPNRYKGYTLKLHINAVTSTSGAPAQYTTYEESGNTVLKIGDPNRTVTGAQEYTIDYAVHNVIGFYDNHDELYWDVNGDQWGQPVTHVAVTLHLPHGAKLTPYKPACFAGGPGLDRPCTIARSGSTVTASASGLRGYETLTYVVAFEKGYFAPASLWERVHDHLWLFVSILGLPLLSFAAGFVWWWRKGRDAPGRGTIVPEYEPPTGISPIEAGALVDFQVDNRDITATIIDMARRGYIKIMETREDRLILKDKLTYSLQLEKTGTSALSTYERTLLTSLFGDLKSAEVVKLADKRNKLYSTAKDLRKAVSKNLTSAGYFRQNPKKYLFKISSLSSLVFVGFILADVATQFHLLALLFGLIVSVIILFLFARLMPARTATGTAAREQLLGLKMYMETAEKDRLEMLEGPNAKYAAKGPEPERTVEFFEKLLPYAIVMNVEKEWAGQFKDIYTAPPEWYSGNFVSFNAGYLAGSLNSGFAATVNNSFSSPASSGGSGFSGGGFAGGGGGGGGGGGW